MNIELRDYFATHAPSPQQPMELAEHCAYRYRYADAMLAAREAGKPEKKTDDDGWIEWNGGECPVDVDTVVEIKTRYFGKDRGRAGQFRWKDMRNASDIIAYRVVQS